MMKVCYLTKQQYWNYILWNCCCDTFDFAGCIFKVGNKVWRFWDMYSIAAVCGKTAQDESRMDSQGTWRIGSIPSPSASRTIPLLPPPTDWRDEYWTCPCLQSEVMNWADWIIECLLHMTFSTQSHVLFNKSDVAFKMLVSRVQI